MCPDEIKRIEVDLKALWRNFRAEPEQIFMATPYGCLCVGKSTAILLDENGDACADQSNAQAALEWVDERMTRRQL